MIQSGDIVRLEIERRPTGQPASLQFCVLRQGRVVLQTNTVHIGLVLLNEHGADDARAAEVERRMQEQPGLRQIVGRAPEERPLGRPSAEASNIGWKLHHLARGIRQPILADCYPAMEATTQPISLERRPLEEPRLTGLSLGSALEEITEPIDYAWELKNGWALVRYRQWYWESARPAEKPAAAGAHQ